MVLRSTVWLSMLTAQHTRGGAWLCWSMPGRLHRMRMGDALCSLRGTQCLISADNSCQQQYWISMKAATMAMSTVDMLDLVSPAHWPDRYSALRRARLSGQDCERDDTVGTVMSDQHSGAGSASQKATMWRTDGIGDCEGDCGVALCR